MWDEGHPKDPRDVYQSPVKWAYVPLKGGVRSYQLWEWVYFFSLHSKCHTVIFHRNSGRGHRGNDEDPAHAGVSEIRLSGIP